MISVSAYFMICPIWSILCEVSPYNYTPSRHAMRCCHHVSWADKSTSTAAPKKAYLPWNRIWHCFMPTYNPWRWFDATREIYILCQLLCYLPKCSDWNTFHVFKFSRIEVLPSLNEIASTGLGLDLYCNVSRPNNIKQRTQDIKDDDFIFEHSLLYWLYRWDYSFDNVIVKTTRMSTSIM